MSVANPEGKYLELLFFGISHYWLLPEEKDVLHARLWLGVCIVPQHGHQHPAGCGKSRGLVDEGLMCGNRRCNVHLRNAGVGTELAGSEQFSPTVLHIVMAHCSGVKIAVLDIVSLHSSR